YSMLDLIFTLEILSQVRACPRRRRIWYCAALGFEVTDLSEDPIVLLGHHGFSLDLFREVPCVQYGVEVSSAWPYSESLFVLLRPNLSRRFMLPLGHGVQLGVIEVFMLLTLLNGIVCHFFKKIRPFFGFLFIEMLNLGHQATS
ncbi:hypothetical protein ACJX0J_038752, partial [Zea mays]